MWVPRLWIMPHMIGCFYLLGDLFSPKLAFEKKIVGFPLIRSGGACDRLNSKWLWIALVFSPSALWGQSFTCSWSLLAVDSTTVGFASSLGAISNLQTDEATVPVAHRQMLNGALSYLICTSPVETEWATGLPSCSSSVLWTSIIVFLVAPFDPFLYCLGQPLREWNEAQ